jgi:hypothetical protein
MHMLRKVEPEKGMHGCASFSYFRFLGAKKRTDFNLFTIVYILIVVRNIMFLMNCLYSRCLTNRPITFCKFRHICSSNI